MTRGLAWVLLVTLVGALVVLVVLNRPQPVEAPPSRTPGSASLRPATAVPAAAATAAAGASSAAPPVPDYPKENVTLWFEKDDDSLLHYESRSVPVPPGPTGRLRAAVGALLAGPATEGLIGNFPTGSALRSVFLAPPGLVTVDLDIAPELLSGLGSHGEWMALEGLVATVLTQAPAGTKGVVVTLRGETPETFAGHVDLARPLWLDRKLVSDEEPAPAASSALPPPTPPETPAAPRPRPSPPTDKSDRVAA